MIKQAAALCALSLLAQPALAQEQAKPQPPDSVPVAETHTVTTLKPNTHRVWLIDTAFPAAEASKTWILDGASGKIEGMFNMGYWPNINLAPNGAEVYSFDSFWEKHTRGARHDYLTTRDAVSLAIKSEVELPFGRFLSVSKKPNAEVTADGSFALSFNLAPTTSVSVVDLKRKAYRGEIEVPGCGLIFAGGPQQFTNICSDGTLQTVHFKLEGDKVTSITQRTKVPVFDAEKDPVLEHSGFDRANHKLYLISYAGLVHPVDISGPVPVADKPWPLQNKVAKKNKWRPGGWQLASFNRANGRLYVLMHQGVAWSHKDPGREIWVVDVTAKKVERRIKLAEKTISMGVSQEADPLIYTITEGTDFVVYDARGKEVAKQVKLGLSPQLIYAEGEGR